MVRGCLGEGGDDIERGFVGGWSRCEEAPCFKREKWWWEKWLEVVGKWGFI
jgi:hypothetical protein